jgi:[acyl-carrier-protein] S-malonyltransferase
MGRDMFEGSAAAREVFETADRVLGYKLSDVCFQGPDEKLRQTEYAQPAILTVSLACLAAAIESGAIKERPAFVAGHSLGEYSALVASGAISFEEGLALLQTRARLMAEAASQNPGTLAAIIGLDEESVMEICLEADVDPCNLNLASQTVIGGPREKVAYAIELAKGRGAQRAIELNVSGAFHSRLMQPAVLGLIEAATAAKIIEAQVPIVANANALALTSAQDIEQELGVQIANPVRWHESITLMAEAGVSSFIEFGPGRVLTGLVKRLLPQARLFNVGSMADISVSLKN